MPKTKTREITIKESRGTFSIFKDSKISKKDYDFSGILALRQLLSNERARIIDVIRTQKPKSIYELAKKLGRGFKTVQEDLKLLERFGVVELIAEKTKKRVRHKPEIIAEELIIRIKI